MSIQQNLLQTVSLAGFLAQRNQWIESKAAERTEERQYKQLEKKHQRTNEQLQQLENAPDTVGTREANIALAEDITTSARELMRRKPTQENVNEYASRAENLSSMRDKLAEIERVEMANSEQRRIANSRPYDQRLEEYNYYG